MSSPGFFYPDVLTRMTAVYKSAVKELKLENAPAIEHERLATCILSIGHSHSDQHRLLESSVRLYMRAHAAARDVASSHRRPDQDRDLARQDAAAFDRPSQ